MSDTTESIEAIGAVWEHDRWTPMGNVYHTGPVHWPAGFDPATLPTPRFRTGQRINFPWDGWRMEGVIEKTRIMFVTGIVCYELRANGHMRHVYDKDDDIRIVLPVPATP